MDFFFRNLEAAQQQARTLSLSASQSARGFAEQLSEHTKSFAEQAATVSSAAAEQASQRWKGLNLQESLQLKALQQTSASQAGPPAQELEQYAITPDFKEFIRSLTYSTFRDFPLEQLPAVKTGDGAKALTPWQEKHALLVVQELRLRVAWEAAGANGSVLAAILARYTHMEGVLLDQPQVKEINELRFVLCPKRMTDAQFWQVYFALARKFLPAEAFDPDHRVPEGADANSQVAELQSGLKRTFESARETAREWSSRASGTLRPAETSAQLHDLIESRSRGNTPKAEDSAARSLSHPFAETPSAQPGAAVAVEDLDNELEAYLQTIANDEDSDEAAAKGPDASESEEAEDLDEYLNELTNGGEERNDEGSEDAVDLDRYMQELQQQGEGPVEK